VICNLLLLIINLMTVPFWIKLISIPGWIIYPLVIISCCIGAFLLRSDISDLVLMGFFGIIGYVLKKLDFDLIPVILGFILIPMIETNVRRALYLRDGDFLVFLDRPYSSFFLFLCCTVVVYSMSRYFISNLPCKK